MKILELNMKHFGKFLEHRMKLLPGMNVIYGDNETGKSTMHAFIRAMFFGIEKTRSRNGRNDEYTLRQPWDNPSYFAGSMRIEYQGRNYRIDRNFQKDEKSVQLICEDTGQEMNADQQNLQELLAGMNEGIFCNTVFIPQARCETSAVLAEELQKFMVNYQETQDGDLDITQAIDQLKRQRREIENKKKQEQDLLDEKIARKEVEIGYISRDMQQLRKKEELYSNEKQAETQYNDTSRVTETGVDTRDEDRGEAKREVKRENETVELMDLTRTTGGSGNRTAVNDRRDRDYETELEEDNFFPVFLVFLNLLLAVGGVLSLGAGIFAQQLGLRIFFLCLGLVFLVLFFLIFRYTREQGILQNRHRKAADETDLLSEAVERELKHQKRQERHQKKKETLEHLFGPRLEPGELEQEDGRIQISELRTSRQQPDGLRSDSQQSDGLQSYRLRVDQQPDGLQPEDLQAYKLRISQQPDELQSDRSQSDQSQVRRPREDDLQNDLRSTERTWLEKQQVLQLKKEQKQELLLERNTQYESLRNELEALYQERERLSDYDRELEALNLAMLRIKELSTRIYRESGMNLSKIASEILNEITEGRYTQIALDEKMEVRVNTPARLLYLHQVSYGTMNQIYFALRMAAGELLTGGEKLPVILDETFVMFDEKRLEAVLRWLQNSGRQVILFTCQKREREILASGGTK